MKTKILLVDDEAAILHALERLFKRSGYEVNTAQSGAEAVEKLAGEDYAVVISDYLMPGMNGIEVLQAAKRINPETVRIILTGYAEVETAIDAINKGDVYRFIRKPWDEAELLATLKEAADLGRMRSENEILQQEVQRQNEELKVLTDRLDQRVKERTAELIEAVNSGQRLNQALQQQNLGIIKVFSSLMDLRHPLLGEHCRRVARKVGPLCEHMGITDRIEVQQITLAALLHDVGKIGLSDVTLAKKSRQLVGAELQEWRNHPIIGQAQVQAIPELVPVGMIVRYHHENFDGTGYPDGIGGEIIPLGARILRVLDSFDRLLIRGDKWRNELTEQVLEDMYKHAGKKFDYDVLQALMETMNLPKHQFMKRAERSLGINSLAVGLTLSRDLRTLKGQLILSAEDELTQPQIDKIKNYSKLHAVTKEVYVYEE